MFRSYQDKVRMPTRKPGGKHTPAGYDCNMCDLGGWLTENDVEIHKKSAHNKKINVIRFENYDRFCSVCMELQESKEDLISHIKSRHFLSSPNAQRIEREIYICDICTNIFFNKHLITAHMLREHLKRKPNERSKTYFKCPACLRDYQLKCMWYHCQMHGLPSISACDICLTNFPTRAELWEHLKSHNRYYTCETCQFSTTRESYYIAHLKSHPQRRGDIEDVSDTLVSRVFMWHKVSLHFLYNVHNPMKGLCPPNDLDICTLCREICSSKKDAKLHIIRDHTEEIVVKKLHVCVCGKEFEHKVVLKQHLMKTKCGLSNDTDEETSLTIPSKKPRVYFPKSSNKL